MQTLREDIRAEAKWNYEGEGCGAKIVGPVTVGDGARIGANAVVLRDVPADSTVVGVPAKPVERRAGHAAAGDKATPSA